LSAPREIVIQAAVEGPVDEVVLGRVVRESGGVLGVVYGRNGKAHLRQRIYGYNNAAAHYPWIVLVDLDNDAECAPPLREKWLPKPAQHMCFRIAVREVETWLLADREAIARFLGVGLLAIPDSPELLYDPKQMMVTLAGRSRRRNIREDMVPRRGSGRKVGPAYTSRLIEFAGNLWTPSTAALNSDSLRRCLARIAEIVSARS